MSVAVSPAWLRERLEDYPEQTAVVDTRLS